MVRTRVYQKVLGNFGFLIIVLVAMTVLVTNILNQIEGHYKTASSSVDLLNQMERLRADIVDVPEYLDYYLKSNSQDYKSIFLSSLTSFNRNIDELKYKSNDTLVTQSLEQVEIIFQEWVTYVAEKRILLKESSSLPDSIAFWQMQLDTIETTGHYLASCRSLAQTAYLRLLSVQQLRIENANNLGKDITFFIQLVNILFAVFAVFLGLYLTKSITAPLNQLRAGTQNIMESKFITLDIKRTDEFGELANDFNTMSRMLEENYTRVKAYSDIMTTLNQNETLSGLVSETLDLLCEQTNAGIGALYIYDRIKEELFLANGYAMSVDKDQILHFKVGEGIPGECARLKKPMEIIDDADAVRFSVQTGVQQVSPKYIYAFPILFQENLIGVIILGSTHRFTELRRGLIESVIPQIGVAITNAQNFEQTQQLSKEISKKHAELNVKTQELEKAYRVKSDFLSNMSHELRTPLNSIIGFTSILLGDRGDPLTADQRKALEKVLKNGKHLLQLINDILDFSKIESGRMHVSIETESVESVVSSAIMTTEHLIRQKNLELKQEIEPNLPIFKTDVLKIKQIIVNLLSNASKFTDVGAIEVKAWMAKDMVHISVKDQGIGIEKSNIDKVFEEFQQIDSSHSRKYKGTGLGLPIARRLARLLGGDLIAESEPGKGSTFILFVPAEMPKTAAEVIEPKKEVPARSSEPKPALPLADLKIEKPKDGEVRVLCIDDEPDVIEILRNYLTPEGYTVFAANSGNEGLKLAEKLQPNVITLDIMMPEKDGWQVLRELKSNPFTRDIPVLIHSMVDNKPLAYSLGAIDYMPKPSDATMVLRMVKKAVSSTENYILVVEDELDYSLLLQKFLKDAGYPIEAAYNGQEALDKVKERIPDLILLDLKMPVMDGFEVIKHLKENAKWKAIPIIIITGLELSTEQRESINQQTVDFLRKADYSLESLSKLLKKSLIKK